MSISVSQINLPVFMLRLLALGDKRVNLLTALLMENVKDICFNTWIYIEYKSINHQAFVVFSYPDSLCRAPDKKKSINESLAPVREKNLIIF